MMITENFEKYILVYKIKQQSEEIIIFMWLLLIKLQNFCNA